MLLRHEILRSACSKRSILKLFVSLLYFAFIPHDQEVLNSKCELRILQKSRLFYE